MEEEKYYCENCKENEVVFTHNSWERFAFSVEEYAWNYECKNCGEEYCKSDINKF